MRRRASLAPFLALAIAASFAHAQVAGASFQGTFSAAVPNGEVAVVLAVAERVTGTLTGPALALDLVGDLDPSDGAVRGVATAAGEAVRFEATLAGDLLTFTLFEVGADGRPNPATAIALELRRALPLRSAASATRGAVASPPSGAPPAPVGAVATLTPALVQAAHEAVEEALTLPESLMELRSTPRWRRGGSARPASR